MIIRNGEEITERGKVLLLIIYSFFFLELARRIINEIYPECERKSKMLEEEEYWDYVMKKELIDINRVLFLFENEFEIISICESNPCSYWIMRDIIQERFP